MKPVMKILIGYDGSECADRALDDLRRAGLPREVEAVIITAADVFLPPTGEDRADQSSPKIDMVHFSEAQKAALHAVEEADRLAQKAGERLREMFPTWSVTHEAQADSPAWALIKKSDQWGPDLLVVGSQGRSAISRFLFGSVSRKVVTETVCSVRVARGRARAEGPVRIVIGLDGSLNSEAAVGFVARREWPEGTEALLISVLDQAIMSTWEWVEDFSEDEESWGKNVISDPARRLTEAGLSVSTKVERGDPKRIILEEAEGWGADCIFVGAKGLRGIDALLLGSVASAIAGRAHCSVEVVRTPDGV